MFSERIQDNIPRDPVLYFKRYNAKALVRGGCRKDSMGNTGAITALPPVLGGVD
jgi:hypothetical protein